MKQIFKIIAAVCLVSAVQVARAQEVRITGAQAEVAGDVLEIAFTVEASGLGLGCDGRLKLEFVVEGRYERLVLPAVVFTGNQRYRFERRRELLSGQFVLPPYHTERGVKKNRTYTIDYKVSVPYHAWMEHASVGMTEYVSGCAGDRAAGSRMVVADVNPVREVVEPTRWTPDSRVYSSMVCFMVPQVEQVKVREDRVEVHIDYPVNVYAVRPEYGNNSAELEKVAKLMGNILGNDLITIDRFEIKGYASPEGRYSANELLARRRAEGFSQYLRSKYAINGLHVSTGWVAEDWDGFIRAVRNSDIDNRDEILRIAGNPDIDPDSKERMIHYITTQRDALFSGIYPTLRRIELEAGYTVQNLTDERARQLIFTNPSLLSLDEMYRVANYFGPGSQSYLEVYEIAAREYPGDVIANNNAAAALLAVGQTGKALEYLRKLPESLGAAYLNLGAYYYIEGDLQKAAQYFNMARDAGAEQAAHNLELLKNNR